MFCIILTIYDHCLPQTQALDLCASTAISQAYPSLEGQAGMESRSLLHIPNVGVTSLMAVQEAGQDIVHAGSNNGEILKVSLWKHHKGA